MKKIKTLNALFLGAFSLLLPINNLSTKANELNFDFSRENSYNSVVIETPELVELITNETLSEYERQYLINNNDYVLKYEDIIPSNKTKTTLIEDLLVVNAYEFSYIDVNDKQITWVPYIAKANNVEQNFVLNSENIYECTFDNITNKDQEIEITYKTTLSLNKNIVNEMINKAYDEANYYVVNQVVEKGQAAYQKALDDFNENEKKYQQYQKDLEKFEYDLGIYKNEELNYNTQKKAYDNYLKQIEEYQKEVEEYKIYQQNLALFEEYQDYLNKYSVYQAELNEFLTKYPDYTKVAELVNYQLNAMALIDTEMTSLNRTVYSAVMGSTVTSVLERKADLVQLEADGKIIDEAYESTLILRNLFGTYFKLKDEQKYSYYCANYYSIKNNLETLLRSLEKLYRQGLVYKVLEKTEKLDKYLILIAQLALVCLAIDDKPVYNYEGYKNPSNVGAAIFSLDYKLNGENNKSISILQVLEGKSFVDVSESNKMGMYIDLSLFPATMPMPPEVVFERANPGEMSPPTPPTLVEDPGTFSKTKPKEPDEVEQTEEPKYSDYVDENIEVIVNAHKNGLVKYRETIDEDYQLDRFTTFTRKNNSTTITITFCDENKNVINTYQTEQGMGIIYEDNIPIKPADNVYSKYKFMGWKYLETNEPFDISNVKVSGKVVPIYEGIEKTKYSVSWINLGKEIATDCYEYGDTPTYTHSIPTKPLVDNTYYVFKGWSNIENGEVINNFEKVSSNQSYYAIYEEKSLVHNSEDVENNDYTIRNTKSNIRITNNNSLNPSDKTELKNIIKYALKEGQTMQFYSDYYKIKLSETTVSRLKNIVDSYSYVESVTASLNVEDLGNGEYYYSIDILINDGNSVSKIEFTEYDYAEVTIRGNYKKRNSSLYLVEEDKETKVRASIENNIIELSMLLNKTYHIYPIYNISVGFVSYPAAVNIEVSKETALYNELVELKVTPINPGVIIENVYITNSANEVLPLNEDGTFNMPDENIYIKVKCKYIKYVVTFKVDGITISAKEYIYGSQVTIPSDPIKTNDENYTYKFIRWDKEITNVTQDVTYEAIFEATPVEKPIIEDKISIILIAKIAIISILCLTIVGIGLIIFFKIRKKNRQKEQKNVKFDGENDDLSQENAKNDDDEIENQENEDIIDEKNIEDTEKE